MAHGCLAGLPEQACAEVYEDRILRGTGNDGFYSTQKLGAFGTDLGAVACFFEERWRRLSPALSEVDQAWLLNEAATRLRGLGRLSEALEPIRATLEINRLKEKWKNAAVVASNLSELELALGRVADAAQDGEQSVVFAKRSGDTSWRIVSRTTLANALHQQGESEPALAHFREAEAVQAEMQHQPPLLYSLPGFRYCDLLLVPAERTAWQRQLAEEAGSGELLDACHAVERRAGQAIVIAEENNWLLDIALDHLTLSRAALLRAVLDPSALGNAQATIDQATKELATAVDGLRAAGTQHWVPAALLTRAWLYALTHNKPAARADLDEAWQIASRGGMRLFMADIHLHRARLFRDKEALKKARALIKECGYWRRKEELEDTERAAVDW